MLPQSLIQSLKNVTGFDEQAFQSVHQSGEQITSIRLNSKKISSLLNAENLQSIPHSPVPWCKNAYYLEQRPLFTIDPIFHAGAYYVQEASSMFLWHVLSQVIEKPGEEKVLDVCAAPGGKSTLLANYFTNGLIVSNEVIKSRANILVENITKWGDDHVVVTNNDPKDFQQLPNYFDVMVIDAPCSGSGLFRKDPNAIQEWSEDNVQMCSQRQQRILVDVLPALKEDGLLIYSTCSYSKIEDEAIADWLVQECELENIAINIHPEWGIVETCSDKIQAKGYRFYPDKVKGEGFFISVFKKKNSSETKKLKEQPLLQPSKQEIQVLASFMQLPNEYGLFKHTEFLKALPQKWMQTVKELSACLYIKKAGIDLGAVKGKDFVPQHELAISCIPITNVNTIHLSKEQALQYLRRKEFAIDAEKKGWAIVKNQDIALGWIKNLPNRINNYYPQEWRILKY